MAMRANGNGNLVAALVVGPEPARAVRLVVWCGETNTHHVHDFTPEGRQPVQLMFDTVEPKLLVVQCTVRGCRGKAQEVAGAARGHHDYLKHEISTAGNDVGVQRAPCFAAGVHGGQRGRAAARRRGARGGLRHHLRGPRQGHPAAGAGQGLMHNSPLGQSMYLVWNRSGWEGLAGR